MQHLPSPSYEIDKCIKFSFEVQILKNLVQSGINEVQLKTLKFFSEFKIGGAFLLSI